MAQRATVLPSRVLASRALRMYGISRPTRAAVKQATESWRAIKAAMAAPLRPSAQMYT